MNIHRTIMRLSAIALLSSLIFIPVKFFGDSQAAPELPPTPNPPICRCVASPLGAQQQIYNCQCGNLQCVATDSGRLACVK
jgi:hypothetical protein